MWASGIICGSSTPTGAQTAERYKKCEVLASRISDGNIAEVYKSFL